VAPVTSRLLGRLGAGAGLVVLALLTALTLVIGAASILHSVDNVNGNLGRLEGALGTANASVDVLNRRMSAIDRIDRDMLRARVLTARIGTSVGSSRRRIRGLRTGTARIDAALARVASSTDRVNAQLAGIDGQTASLAGSVGAVGRTVTPLLATNRSLHGSVLSMRSGIGEMNGSLRYVIRVLDYMAAPPAGGSFSINVRLDPRLLPDLKGLTVKTDPIAVFRRGQWKTYGGP
jgi:hypothetical protein